ncbi:MAG: hypothetical protein COA86_17675 [Kangiella sp.]|nr:MAG: hypothetical protein COA86_17675 [Kangiella sp.]
MVAGLVLSVTGYTIYQSAEGYLIERFLKQQEQGVKTIASFIDGDFHSDISLLKDENLKDNQLFNRYQQALDNYIAVDKDYHFVYTLFINEQNRSLRYALLPSSVSNNPKAKLAKNIFTGKELMPDDFFFDHVFNLIDQAKTTSNDHSSSSILHVDGSGTISFGLIVNRNKQPTGIVVIEVSNRQIDRMKQDLFRSMLVTIGLLFISLLLASIIFAHKITRPFEKLTDAIERLINNELDFQLSLSDFGGFSYTAKQFNLMLLKLKVSRNELIGTNKAFSRFVPHKVLKLISPNGIQTTKLGECIEKEMTILFCDIRGFTQLSESMKPKESFAFINRYLNVMVPVINKHGGTVDKYMGDGIMALFPNSPDNALNAAVGMNHALSKYNQKLQTKGLPIVKIGLGLHTGRMMLGTVGTSSRMDVTVISDTVNAAARIEALTKTFQSSILISEELRIKLNQFNKRELRFIATCFVQGKAQPMTIYEVFSNDTISLRNEKLENQQGMIDAWHHYKNGDTDRAITIYQKLMEKSPLDKAQLALIEVVQNGRL